MQINISQAIKMFDELVGRARSGERITIMKDGVPVADLVPHAESESVTREEHAASLIESMREFRRQHGVRMTVEEILEFRDEGRR